MPDLNDITDLDFAGKMVERTIVEPDGTVHIRKTQRCDPILEAVAAARDLPKGNRMRHVASIPLVVYYQWAREAGIPFGTQDFDKQMREVVRKKLADGSHDRLKVHGF